MWNLKYDTDKHIQKKRLTEYEEQTCACQGEGDLVLAEANYYIQDR